MTNQLQLSNTFSFFQSHFVNAHKYHECFIINHNQEMNAQKETKQKQLPFLLD